MEGDQKQYPEPTLNDLGDFLSGKMSPERRTELGVGDPKSPFSQITNGIKRRVSAGFIAEAIEGKDVVRERRKELAPKDFADAIGQVTEDDRIDGMIEGTLRQLRNEKDETDPN